MQAAAEGRLEVVMALINELAGGPAPPRRPWGDLPALCCAEAGVPRWSSGLIGDGGMQIGACRRGGPGRRCTTQPAGRTRPSWTPCGACPRRLSTRRTIDGVTPLMRLVQASDEPSPPGPLCEVRGGGGCRADDRGETALMHAAREGPRERLFAAHVTAHKAEYRGRRARPGGRRLAIAEEHGCTLTLHVLANRGAGCGWRVRHEAGAEGGRSGLDSKAAVGGRGPEEPQQEQQQGLQSVRKVAQRRKEAQGSQPPAWRSSGIGERGNSSRMGREQATHEVWRVPARASDPTLSKACLLMRTYFGDTVSHVPRRITPGLNGKKADGRRAQGRRQGEARRGKQSEARA